MLSDDEYIEACDARRDMEKSGVSVRCPDSRLSEREHCDVGINVRSLCA